MKIQTDAVKIGIASGNGNFERVHVPDNAYQFTVKTIGKWYTQEFTEKNRDGKDEVKKSEKVPMEFEINFEIENDGKKENAIVMYYPSLSVYDGKGFGNVSHLYDVLVKAKLLGEFNKTAALWEGFEGTEEEKNAKMNDAMVQWMKDNLLGKKGLCTTKTKTSKHDGAAYSVVDKVVNFN